jgi:WD40 repeat protein
MQSKLVSVGKFLCFHDLQSETPIHQISPHAGSINCVAFSPYIKTHNMHAYLIATGGVDGKIILTNAATYQTVLCLIDKKYKVNIIQLKKP